MFNTGCVRLNLQTLFLFVLLFKGPLKATNANESYASQGPKIIGGSSVPIEEIPYQVSIRWLYSLKYDLGSDHFCGGSLISRRVVLSAAHCFYSLSRIENIQLVMGNTYSYRDSSTEIKYGVADIRMHKLYDNDTVLNDIALMLIKGIVPTSSLVQPIELASRQYGSGTICQISGWGMTHGHHKVLSFDLRVTQLKIEESNLCLPPINEPLSQICATQTTEKLTGACRGDSGGPFVCKAELVGVVSYGGESCKKDTVFTNVFYYKDWIKSQTKKLRAGSKALLSGYWHCLAVFVIFLYNAVH